MEGIGQGNELVEGQPFRPDLRRNPEPIQDCRHLVLSRRLLADDAPEVITETLPPVGKAAADEAEEFLLVKGLDRQRLLARRQNNNR